MNFKLMSSLVLIGLLVLFVTQNVAVVEIRFMFWQVAMSRSLLIFFLLAVGILVGWLLHSYFVHSSNKVESKEMAKKLAADETKEV